MKLKHLVLFIVPVFFLFSCNDEEESLPPVPSLEEEVLTEINAHRAQRGLSALEMNNTLRNLARGHSEKMALEGDDPDHAGFEARVEEIRAELGNGSVAENVASGGGDVTAIVQLWIDSEGHKDNIEGSYDLTGIGVVKDEEGRHFYTQIFFNQP